MGEQAAKIGKKLEGFGVNFFANLGWTELTQDKEIKCTRSSHKKKTHGIDLLCKFTNPYIAGNQGIVVECKNRQMGSITRATIEEWVKELIFSLQLMTALRNGQACLQKLKHPTTTGFRLYIQA